MRYIYVIFSVLGIISFIFLAFSIYTINKIVYPEQDLIKDKYYAIVVLSGNPERAILAAEKYFEKNASTILLSREITLFKDYLTENSIPTYKIYLKILTKKINKKNIILFGNNTSTYDEIRELSKLSFISNKNILIVTDKYHHYRVRKLLKHFNISNDIDLYPLISNYNLSNKYHIKNIFLEYTKIILFYLFTDYDNLANIIYKK